MFVPLKLMLPDADIPCVQISMLSSLDPGSHIKLGRALAGLKDRNILLMGSGFSFHNLGAFGHTSEEEKNTDFHAWLHETLMSGDVTTPEREDRLKGWEDAPNARFCHPREDHLLPLHVCYGVAKRACSEFFALNIMQKRASVYLWQ